VEKEEEGFKNAFNGKEEEEDDLKESDESALSLPLFMHDDEEDEEDDDDESTLEKIFARRNILYLNLSSSSLCVFVSSIFKNKNT